MNKSTFSTLVYGMAGLACMLFSSLGYVAGHKFFSVVQIIGIAASMWQVIVAFLFIAAAGGIGESLLKFSDRVGLVRLGLTVATGLFTLSIGVLAWGSLVGTSLISFTVPALVILVVFYKNMLVWLRNLNQLRDLFSGKFEKAIAIGLCIILCGNLILALAPPVEWDSLVYHYALPNAYINTGHITYLPDTMFWGMPQLTEMMYLPLAALAGIETGSVFCVLIGALALLGIAGYVQSKFSNIAAWIAVAALLSGGASTWLLSSGYVDWTSILFGWAILVALDDWLEKQNRKRLILAGVFCGAALGIKYSAGVVLVGVILVLLIMQKNQTFKTVFINIGVLGLTTTITSSPWWIKNFLATGNPFYPFFVPAGAMDQIRLTLYQNMPVWRDWRAVILIPWQATFMGLDGKEGFSASIGPLLVGLGPLALINWQTKTEPQKKTIQMAGIIAITGSVLWAIASRMSGFLIQTRLYLVIFPALAVLAGAGLDAVWNLKSTSIRFGKLTGMLALFMFGLNLLSFGMGVISINPALYLLRGEERRSYLLRRLGGYTLAMESIQNLPIDSHTLMLWEPKGYYCQPRCDSDEILDRWSSDSSKHADSQAIIQFWQKQGYTHLLVNNSGKDFVREENPQGTVIDWDLLGETLEKLPVEQQIPAGVSYTLYRLP